MTHRAASSGILAVSSWSWHDAYYAGAWSLLDLPAEAVAAGIDSVEANDFMLPPPRLSRVRKPLLALAPGAPAELWRYSRASLRALWGAAEAAGVRILGWTVNSDFAVPAPHWPSQAFYLHRGLAAARSVRASLLRLNLGGAPAAPPACDALIARRLAAFVARAARRTPGLTFTVENHWGISADIDRHVAIVDRAADGLPPDVRARFGCCFDPGNVPHGPDRERHWRLLAARANHFHLKTTRFDESGEDRTLPHAALFALLREAGYRGNVTIEFAGDGDPAHGVRRSAALFARHGAGLWAGSDE